MAGAKNHDYHILPPSIWPLFGVANQLLAVIALAICVTIVLKISRNTLYVLVPLVPLLFLSVTEITAGIMNVSMFFNKGTTQGNINGAISIILIGLVIIVLTDCSRLWLKLLKSAEPVGMSVETDRPKPLPKELHEIPS